MFTVGLDVHQSRSSLCILDAQGKTLRQTEVKGGIDAVVGEFAALQKALGQPFQVCFEASTGYGVLHDRLAPLAAKVAVAHPKNLRLIFQTKKKNNKVDAAKLATLCFLRQVPGVHVPTPEVRSWRGFIEYRGRIVARRVQVKNQIRALLRGLGHRPPAGKSFWTRQNQQWFKDLPLPTAFDKARRTMLLRELADLTERIQEANGVLNEFARGHAGVALLQTIPGVGPRTAEAFAAYVDDPKRLTSRTIGSYLGLIPGEDSTGEHRRLGHITREGPATLRKLLTEAAWRGACLDEGLKERFERFRRGDATRKKIAVVAQAHRLSRIMLAMLRTGEAYRGAAAEAGA